jgi:hypothetical protein
VPRASVTHKILSVALADAQPDLRWKIDALPDPTQPTGSLISGRVAVRRKTGALVGRRMAGRRAIGLLNGAQATESRIIEIIEAGAGGQARTIRDGATDARMEDSHERMELLRVVTTNDVPTVEARRTAARDVMSLNRIS